MLRHVRPLLVLTCVGMTAVACSGNNGASSSSGDAPDTSSTSSGGGGNGGGSSSGGASGGMSNGGSGATSSGGNGGGSSSSSSSGGGGSTSGGTSGSTGSSSSSFMPRTMCEPDTAGTSSSSSGGGSSSSSTGSTCEDDTYEPNNLATEASAITLDGAMTTLSGLRSCTDGDDFFRFTVPANSGLKVTMDFLHDESDLDLYLYRASAPTVSVDESLGTDDQEVVQAFLFTTETEVLLRVKNYSLEPAGYTLTIETIAGGNCSEDVGEEDDTEETARTLSTERVTGRTACAGDVDFFKFTVPSPRTDTIIQLNHGGAAGTLTTSVFVQGQATPLATGVQAMDADTITFESTAGTTYVLKVEYAGTAAGALYDVRMLTGGFCDDDFGEENDDEANASDITTGAFARVACETDADYYAFTVPASEPGAQARFLYEASDGDLEAILFTAGNEATPVATAGAYDAMTRDRTITFDPQAGTAYFLRVRNPSGQGGVRYEIRLGGVAFCQDDGSEPNDTLETASMLEDFFSSRVVCGSNADFYSFTVPSAGEGTRLIVSQSAGEVDVVLTDASGAAVATTEERTSTSVTLTFTSVAGTTYVAQVSNRAGSTGARYYLDIREAPPANETCMAAISLTSAQTVTGNTAVADNDLQFSSRACTGYSNTGGDVVYRVTVGAGQTLTATLNSEEDLALWLLEDCQSRCCWAGVDDGLGGDEETLTWTNPTGSSLDLYLGVDGFTTSAEGEFTLAVDIQ